jgi:hypothetical protein
MRREPAFRGRGWQRPETVRLSADEKWIDYRHAQGSRPDLRVQPALGPLVRAFLELARPGVQPKRFADFVARYGELGGEPVTFHPRRRDGDRDRVEDWREFARAYQSVLAVAGRVRDGVRSKADVREFLSQ